MSPCSSIRYPVGVPFAWYRDVTSICSWSHVAPPSKGNLGRKATLAPGRNNAEMKVDLAEGPENFLAWGAFRRALLAKTADKEPPATHFGFKP